MEGSQPDLLLRAMSEIWSGVNIDVYDSFPLENVEMSLVGQLWGATWMSWGCA